MKPFHVFSVNSHKFKVYKIKGLAANTGHDGETDFESKTIKIDARLTGEDLMRTLLHEYRHVFHYQMGFMEFLGHQAQEIDCEATAAFLLGNFDIKLKK